jgi:hypothetical protein
VVDFDFSISVPPLQYDFHILGFISTYSLEVCQLLCPSSNRCPEFCVNYTPILF